jgi:hypothetical protein
MAISRSSNPGVGHLASDKKVAANRRNAKKSTGPRSKTGKKAVRNNAVKHGLSADNAGTEVEALTDLLHDKLLNKSEPSALTHVQVRDVAEMELIARRAREAKVELLRGADDPANTSYILDTYKRIDRYERRALSRKKSILRTIVSNAGSVLKIYN